MTNEQASSRVVTGTFADSAGVERAYRAVEARGYDKDAFNVVMSDDTRKRYFADDREVKTELAAKTMEGGELGGPTGGRVGVALPIVAAVAAAVVIPGLGFVLAGPIAAAVAAAGAAGIAGGLIAAFADWGLPEERLRQYEAAVNDGAILVGLKAKSREDAAAIATDWKAAGGQHVYS